MDFFMKTSIEFEDFPAMPKGSHQNHQPNQRLPHGSAEERLFAVTGIAARTAMVTWGTVSPSDFWAAIS